MVNEQPMWLIDQVGPDFVKPPVRMVGEDGNGFAVMVRVCKALDGIGRHDLAQEYCARAMASTYSQNLGQLIYTYCDVDPGDPDSLSNQDIEIIQKALLGSPLGVSHSRVNELLDKLERLML
jgi:hypothetical protein